MVDLDKERRCWVCGNADEGCGEKPACYAHCGSTPDGKHVGDPETVAHADSDDPELFDIWCRACGQSGAFSVDLTPAADDIQWD